MDDVDLLRLVVDAMEQAVWTATGCEQSSQLTLERLAGAVGLARQIPERELDDRRNDARRDALQRAAPGPVNWTSCVTVADSAVTLGQAELGSDRVLALRAPRRDVGLGPGDSFADARL